MPGKQPPRSQFSAKKKLKNTKSYLNETMFKNQERQIKCMCWHIFKTKWFQHYLTLILYIFFYRKAVCVYYNEPTCGQYLHEDFFKLIHHLLPTLTILTQPPEQNLEAAAGAVLENFVNFTGKHLFLISFI